MTSPPSSSLLRATLSIAEANGTTGAEHGSLQANKSPKMQGKFETKDVASVKGHDYRWLGGRPQIPCGRMIKKEIDMSVVIPLKSETPCSSVREDSFFQFVARATDDELLLFLEQGFPLITVMASYSSTKKKDVIEVREANVVERKPRFASS
jgi:hypothetical protein